MIEQVEGWTLIRSAEEWRDYCYEYSMLKEWAPDSVQWPSKPKSYPCMVSTYSPHLFKTLSAFVYVSQAIHLLTAAGMNVGRNPAFASESERQEVTGDQGEMVASGQVIGDQVAQPKASQANFNRYVQANLLAMWRALRDNGIASAEMAHDLTIQALSDVDRWSAMPPDKKRVNGSDYDFLSKF